MNWKISKISLITKAQIMFKPLSSGIIAILIILAVASQATASVMQYLEVEDLTRISAHVFRGNVQSVEVVWTPDHRSIQTVVKVRVNETFKGSLSAGQVVTFRQIGGEIDGYRLDYIGRPEFTAGESVVLFAGEPQPGAFVVMALKQGKMTVSGNTIVRDFSGLSLVTKGNTLASMKPVTNPRTTIPMSELRTRILRAK